jgi:GNAT superfamily N-acetyltransferase
VVFSIAPVLEGGSKKTVFLAHKHGKPVLRISRQGGPASPELALLRFIQDYNIKVLNVAGPRASKEPGVYDFVKDTLQRALSPAVEATVQYRPLRDAEVEKAVELAQRVFTEFVAGQHSLEGCEEFRSYASAAALRERHSAGCVTFAAERQGRIIGMLHLRNANHIAMLFVEGRDQRQRIGSGLVRVAEQYAVARQPTPEMLTVASTPNAIDAYRRMGFVPVAEEQVLKGLRFTPMERKMRTQP